MNCSRGVVSPSVNCCPCSEAEFIALYLGRIVLSFLFERQESAHGIYVCDWFRLTATNKVETVLHVTSFPFVLYDICKQTRPNGKQPNYVSNNNHRIFYYITIRSTIDSSFCNSEDYSWANMPNFIKLCINVITLEVVIKEYFHCPHPLRRGTSEMISTK
jgi:hypothetical protein